MKLNLPVLDELTACKSLLLAGMGGGYDVFCALPIYFELKKLGINVHLASYSFSAIDHVAKKEQGEVLSDTLVGVNPSIAGRYVYFPEFYLSEWFKTVRDEDVTVWSFFKTGVQPLLANYRILADRLSLDGILLLDGGVDSLNRGNELHLGTFVEDTASLVAVHELETVPFKMLGCLGFGAEHDMAYAHVLENVAVLSREGAFWGTCSLLPQMDVYQDYEAALQYVQEKPYQDPSMINSSVMAAVQGRYGAYYANDKTRGKLRPITPLMAIYWFFDLAAVAQRNMIYEGMLHTETSHEMFRVGFEAARRIPKRGQNGSLIM